MRVQIRIKGEIPEGKIGSLGNFGKQKTGIHFPMERILGEMKNGDFVV